ncbi:ubiquitin-specific protease otu1 [Marasmius crinis-equi]|uniref:Ubiquitin thioesterase OTU n=1 Tax=Marasmius crinis-equi TaxID=585013 RepID=A0ABR3FRI5_9AGAR
MSAIRLRHPQGMATITIPLDSDTFSVQDLQQEIYSATNILPSRQIVKTGYPPRSLTLISELPLSSLGLAKGDQLIVAETSDPAVRGPSAQAAANQGIRPPPSSSQRETARSQPSQNQSSGPESVETDGGYLVHRVVPDDNSCLFSSVALVFEQDISKAPRLRQVVADHIQKDPETYNEAILGMDPEKYKATIQKPSSWGGAIELSIFAKHYNTEICSIDVETGRIDNFSPPGPEVNGMRCIVIYSGIHYDAATLAPSPDAPSEWHQTVFPVDNGSALEAGKKLADRLRAKKAYTNTATFDLKCEECGKGLKGEKEARAHAEQSGHVRFGEY